MFFPFYVLRCLHFTGLGVGGSKTEDPNPNGSKNSMESICSLLLFQCNFGFLLLFQNIYHINEGFIDYRFNSNPNLRFLNLRFFQFVFIFCDPSCNSMQYNTMFAPV
jgi:hypothetical protein